METTSEKAFHAYGIKMRAVTEFWYLGRVMTNMDDDWQAVEGNLRKARVTWGRLERILGQEGADLKVSHKFLYCHDTAGPPLRGGDLGPHQEDGVCPGRVSGQGSTAVDGTHATPWEGRKADLPPLTGATKEAGIVRARTLVLRRQNTVA